jgi:hypothetical protein
MRVPIDVIATYATDIGNTLQAEGLPLIFTNPEGTSAMTEFVLFAAEYFHWV